MLPKKCKGVSLPSEDLTPLWKAASQGRLAAVEACLATGTSDLYKREPFSQMTPLLVACQNGHLNVCKALVRAGAAVDDKDAEGRTALAMAINKHANRMASFLIKSGAPVTKDYKALEIATVSGKCELVTLLIEHKADVGYRPCGSTSPLLVAARHPNLPVLRNLLDAKASMEDRDTQGNTPLLVACMHCSEHNVTELIKSGADTGAVNSQGNTALMEAAYYGRVDNVSALLRAKADLGKANDNSDTALLLAIHNNYNHVVRTLWLPSRCQ